MTIEEIRNTCKKFPAVTEDIKWQDHLCFNVGGKMFIITSPDTVPQTASLKVDDEDFEELTSREGIIPAPYLARYKWIYMDDISRLQRKEWEKLLKKAYSMVYEKLPAKVKKTLL